MNYKRDFPIFSHFSKTPLVYLDSAATSQKPKVVIDTVNEFYETYNANIHRGIYDIAEKATQKIEDTRKKVAAFINAADPSEIVFTHGTTEGLNLLAHSLCNSLTKDQGILLSEVEHHSNIVPWQHFAKKRSLSISYLPALENGQIDFSEVLNKDTLLTKNINKYSVISLAHVSNTMGSIHVTSEIIKKIREVNKKSIIILDAAQSAPHVPIDVQELDADCIVFSGHKMFAPSGVGILWGKKKLLNMLEPFTYGSQMIREVSVEGSTFVDVPEKFEAGTLPLESIIGLGSAIDYITSLGMNTLYAHEQRLTAYTLSRLKEIDTLRILGSQNPEERVGVISFIIEGIHPHDISQVLAERNICVRAGHHCAMPVHRKFGIPASVRVSLQIYNDVKDIDAFIEGLKLCVDLFRI